MKTKLTYDSIISTITKLCQKTGIVLVLNDPAVGKDNGWAYAPNEIHLGKNYSSNRIMLAIFSHEYGHIMISRRKSKKYKKISIFREEFLAWAIGIELINKYFGISFTKSQGNFMLDCLKTYSKQHYHFTKSYQKDEQQEDEED